MINYKQAGERIRRERNRLGLTQEALAETIEITPSFYSQIETGKRKASIDTYFRISQALSVSLDYILGNEVDAVSSEKFDDTEYRIFHQLKQFSAKQKEFVLAMMNSLSNLA